MQERRDIYQKKMYAVTRMNRAMARLKRSDDGIEKAKAAFWVAAWMNISGLRQYRLERRDHK